MNYTMTKQNDEIVMRLLHYFITVQNYNPVVLHGAKDEIWLENLDSDYKIIRIVSNYIHNDEQLNFDIFRTKQIMKSIKKKTLSFKIPTLSIFINLGDNVHLEKETNFDYITCLKVKSIDDIVKNNVVLTAFPDVDKILSYKEEGMNLFLKLTSEINRKTETDAYQAEDIFKPKDPIVTKIIIAINIILFLLMYILGNGSENAATLIKFGANNRFYVLNLGQYYRLITSSFLHIGIFHLFVNMYSLNIIGSQIESFFGKTKYLVIYFGSALCGSLLSIAFTNNISAGASGAIFGLLGAIVYFGYHYRIYLGNTLKSQIIPIIILNLSLGFLVSGIDNACHIGGLIGGYLLAMACGIKYRTDKKDRTNGIVLTTIFIAFLICLINMI